MSDWRELCISHGERVRDALRRLEETERKVVFVTDGGDRLIGTLSDGDVRRWILRGGDLDGAVEQVCNRQPYTAVPGYDLERVRREMLHRQIACVPVLDEGGRIVDALTWAALLDPDRQAPPPRTIDLPVVIMAGGKGTRLAPFTSVLPKPLIPVGGKTVIELIMESFTACGVNRFILSVNYKSRIIKSYFDELEPPFAVEYVYEEAPLGTMGSLGALRGRFDRDVIVTNCDVIVRTDYAALVDHHREDGCDLTMVGSLKNYTIPYGVCELAEGGRLAAIREKPEYNFLVNTGLYVLKPEVIDLIPPDEVFQATDLIERLLQRGRRVGVYPIGDKAWIDTGEWPEYRNAVWQLTADRRR